MRSGNNSFRQAIDGFRVQFGQVLLAQQNEALRRSSMAEALQSMWSSANNRTRAAEMDAGAVMPPWWAQVAGIGNRLGQAAGRAMTGGMM